MLREELPNAAILHLGMPQNPSRSEGHFFGMLLAAARHERPDSGSALQRRFRLYNRLAEMVERASGRLLIVFVDEAQRLELEHYERLRDMQDEMERRGIRMFTILVGQPGILHRKTSSRQSIDTSQIVSRFTIEEMRFDGFRSPADLKVSLSAYDESVFPEGSDWTFTRFFFQRAYDAGFRLGRQNELVWEAFGDAHRHARFDFAMELPMEFVARAVEIVLGENAKEDASGSAPSQALWALAVEESDYIAALKDLRIVFVDDIPAGS
jgi:hypothetical protein